VDAKQEETVAVGKKYDEGREEGKGNKMDVDESESGGVNDPMVEDLMGIEVVFRVGGCIIRVSPTIFTLEDGFVCEKADAEDCKVGEEDKLQTREVKELIIDVERVL
jgi:hypothetical protein